MQGAWIIKIAIVVFFLLIHFLIKAAKAKALKAGPPPPPQQNFNNPFQQTPPANQNPFQQQQNPFQQQQNPFQQQQNPFQQNQSNSGSSQDGNFFDNNKDAFSQASTRNDNSNMGAGSQSFYCRYCGKKFSSVDMLSKDTCFKHPKSDQGLQKHVIFQGAGRPNVGF